jgi:hypothetical protein
MRYLTNLDPWATPRASGRSIHRSFWLVTASSRRRRHGGCRETGLPLPHRGRPPRGRATAAVNLAGSGSAATLLVVQAPPAPPTTTMRPLSASAGRLARSSRVAGHGLVQSAERLLDAGIDLVRTTGAALACSRWLGRELGQPCPGLVGDRAGLVALGAVEAIIRVGLRGVGHSDHPGSRSGRATRPAPRSEGNFQAPARARFTLRLLPGRVNPASAVTSRSISPAIYGERGSAVAAGRLVSQADDDLGPLGRCWGAGRHLRGSAEERPRFGRGDQGTIAASGVAPGGVLESASAPPGPLGSYRTGGGFGVWRSRSHPLPRCWAWCCGYPAWVGPRLSMVSRMRTRCWSTMARR